mmetsp:Transcript_19782/g.34137  ORF Transcript_19782/g.34137 Transcript_19782/m.34137 type:complete len:213 (-) Transcript_19782:210-848(-)
MAAKDASFSRQFIYRHLDICLLLLGQEVNCSHFFLLALALWILALRLSAGVSSALSFIVLNWASAPRTMLKPTHPMTGTNRLARMRGRLSLAASWASSVAASDEATVVNREAAPKPRAGPKTARRFRRRLRLSGVVSRAFSPMVSNWLRAPLMMLKATQPTTGTNSPAMMVGRLSPTAICTSSVAAKALPELARVQMAAERATTGATDLLSI